MFRIKNVATIAVYLLLSILTLSIGCSAEDYNYFTTRHPFWDRFFTTKRNFWEDYTDTPKFRDVPPGSNDVVIFFTVLFIGSLVIALLSYYAFCQSESTRTSNSSSDYIRQPVSGAVIHPPPRGPGTIAVAPTAPSVDFPSFTNAGYQSGRDVPPDYAAVALGDLTSTNRNFPAVVKMETPPPQYQNDGKPFM